MKIKPFHSVILLIILVLSSSISVIPVIAQVNPQSIENSKQLNLIETVEPIYADPGITIDPYPVMAGQPAEVCIRLSNSTTSPQEAAVTFSWANFGLGLPFTPINGPVPVSLPPHSVLSQCTHWVPPLSGNLDLQVLLQEEGYEPQVSQRNIDVIELLQPGVPSPLIFPVRNPLGEIVTINLGLVPYLTGWSVQLSQTALTDMAPFETRSVTLTVTPPAGQPLPPDNTPVVDVEAHANAALIGGFRKVFRPPVSLHNLKDPIYAESGITIDPYPVLAGQSTEVCVNLRNPTPFPQEAAATFSWANFGLGLPFTPINGPVAVSLPPHSVLSQCTHWVPPLSGNLDLQVLLQEEGYEPQVSQRNIDVIELLQPGVPSPLIFPVRNPLGEIVTINLGLVPYLPGWSVQLSQTALTDMAPFETRLVTLTVTPPAGQPLHPDNTPVVDVEAHANAALIGGFRKVFRPPVSLHNLKDPIYAESGITIDPYPVLAGQSTEVCVNLRNPTPFPQEAAATFSWANFGLGLPFTPINGPVPVSLPPHSVLSQCTHWVPPLSGNLDLQVLLQEEGYEPQVSQRNMDVIELLQPGVPSPLIFPVRNPLGEIVTINLGLVPYLPGWSVQLSQTALTDMAPFETRLVTLTVTPPAGQPLPPDNTPVVDVEGYIKGNLLGGIELLKLTSKNHTFLAVVLK